MRFAFVMDGLDRVNPATDTSYAFMVSADGRGHECWHGQIPDVEWVDGRVVGRLRRIELAARPAISLVGEPERHDLANMDGVFIRKDPPFDRAYAYATLVLEQLRGRTLMLNDPRGLREANEKLYALHFPRAIPRLLVSADGDAIHRFVEQVGGTGVIKPLDGAGGLGVMAVRSGGSNARAIVELLTDQGAKVVMVQEFLDQVWEGDKRVLLLDGEPLGAILRIPRGGDLRANIHVGSEVRAAELSDRERAIVDEMAPRLKADGLIFVGLDFIGERLTEVNVTSPTGILELDRFSGSRPADKVIAWVERHAIREG